MYQGGRKESNFFLNQGGREESNFFLNQGGRAVRATMALRTTLLCTRPYHNVPRGGGTGREESIFFSEPGRDGCKG